MQHGFEENQRQRMAIAQSQVQTVRMFGKIQLRAVATERNLITMQQLRIEMNINDRLLALRMYGLCRAW